VRRLAITTLAVGVASLSIALPAAPALGKHAEPKQIGQYAERALVSDVPGAAELLDPALVNPWGLAFSSTSPAWVADNGTGVSTLYAGATDPLAAVTKAPLTVSIPGGAPTGAVFNDTGGGFVVTAGASSGSSAFLFASESGIISGWSPAVPPPAPSTLAQVGYTSAAGAIFKGLAIANPGTGPLLYATDFHNGRVVVLDASFQQITLPGGFSDPAIPTGYAPFGIEIIGGQVFVTYAKQDAAAQDDVAGKGNGFVDVYDPNGNLLRSFAAGGPLNSPWGITLAPAGFGAAGGALLIGNFGDGRINAYDPASANFLGSLGDERGKKLAIDGLWALKFGNGVIGTPETLLFTAGPDGETHGLFGELTAVAGG
jgi:uncharacterized protein (TIGR03118 family)